MGLSAAESGFKQFKWNDKYNDVNNIADILEKKASRFRDKDKKEQTLELADLLRNKIKDINRLKKQLVDKDDLLRDRYPSSLFKKLPKAFDLMIDETSDPLFENEIPDSMATARALKAAIVQDGGANIIFAGKESIDCEGFQTMHRLAAAMDIPVASTDSAAITSPSLRPPRPSLRRQTRAPASDPHANRTLPQARLWVILLAPFDTRHPVGAPSRG